MKIHGAGDSIAARGDGARGFITGMSSLGRWCVVVVEVDEVLRGAEGVGPVVSVEVWKLGKIGRYRVKPLVEHGMKLGCHATGVGVENKWDTACMSR